MMQQREIQQNAKLPEHEGMYEEYEWKEHS